MVPAFKEGLAVYGLTWLDFEETMMQGDARDGGCKLKHFVRDGI